MLNENQIELLITACLTGKATGEEQHILDTWVHANPEHLRYYQDFVNIWQVTHPAFDPEGIDVVKAGKRMNKKISETNVVKKIWVYWQRAAAIVLIPLLLLSVYLFVNDRADTYEATEYQELKTPHGMYSLIDLPDGSKVWLNGGSSLKYPLKFRQGQRQVSLGGEGYFEVQSDRKNPFVVKTAQMTLTATGTAFNVEAYATDSMTAVTMANGVVDIAFGQAAPVALKPGERALYNNHTQKDTILKTETYKWYAWKDGLMIFRNDPLSYVFKRLEQTFNVEIILKDVKIADEPCRATFEDESLDEILRLLGMSSPIRFVQLKRTQNANHTYEKQQIEVYKRKSAGVN
ncbi:MAG: FecR domain-containing protein [Tannerella sp.]|nr:FecR domain-containing protein [Tannerella sp.]